MRFLFSVIVCLLPFTLAQAVQAETVHIYAAASTADAIDEILAAYDPGTGTEVIATYAASSTLARQINNGAPAQMFLSANEAWMDDLAGRGRIAAGTRANLLTNRLVLVAPRMMPLAYEPAGSTSLAEVLNGRELALGHPDGVPAGIYAREALEHLGEWDAIQESLVFGNSVRAALFWVARAEVSAAIVYESDTSATLSVIPVATFPAESHSPIRYPLAVIDGQQDIPAVMAFYAFLQGPEAAAIFEAYGFGIADSD